MDVSAKKAKIWRKEFEGKNGTFYRYTTSVSKKTQDGKYVNAYIPIYFSKKADAPDKIENGALCDFEGFMSVEFYTDKDGNTKCTPQIVVTSALFDGDGFAQAEEELPF